LDYAQEMTAALHVIIGQLKRHLGIDRVRLLDVPCGDLRWMSRFLQTRSDVVYTGADIVREIVDHHRAAFPAWKFLHLDVVSQPIDLADYDLIMTRMMMQHLTHADVARVLHQFSNATLPPRRRPVFLLATSFYNTADNRRMNVEDSARFTLLNLAIEPFRLEPPLCLFRDGPPISVHFMGLWRLPLRVLASCRKPVPFRTRLSKQPMYSCIDWSLPASLTR